MTLQEPQSVANPRATRRAVLTHGLVAGSAAALAGGFTTGIQGALSCDPGGTAPSLDAQVAFYGPRQVGITTPQQAHVVLAAFDLTSDRRGLRQLMTDWARLAAALSEGRAAPPRTGRPDNIATDSGIADGLRPARFTMTVGFGSSLFDRLGLAARRPTRLEELPEFPGDLLEPLHSGGDLVVQMCADDPQVLSHAFLQTRALSMGVATLRWSENGFLSRPADGHAPRNLLGLQDGTANPADADRERLIWVDDADEPEWIRGGTYLVYRRIRLKLPDWALTPVDERESVIGRRLDGSPLSADPGAAPSTPPDLDAKNAEGAPLISHRAHVRQMREFEMFRRSYNYDHGFDALRVAAVIPHSHGSASSGIDKDRHDHLSDQTAGHDGYDAGLLFLTYNADPTQQFVPAQRALATNDDLNRFLEPTATGIFAVPRGVRPGGWFGEGLV